jgi:Glycosyl transferase family 2
VSNTTSNFEQRGDSAIPLISVVVPSYNHGRYLRQTLRSVLNQTYENLELVVCDDGSTDDSPAIIREIAASDSRVRTLFKRNGGIASTLNAGIEISSGEIVCFLDSDDFFVPHKLERVAEAMHDSGFGLCLHQTQSVNAASQIIEPPRPTDMPYGDVRSLALRSAGRVYAVQDSGIAVRRSALERILPIPDHLNRAPDAYIIGLLQFITHVVIIEQPLAMRRLHGTNEVGFRSITAAKLDNALHDYNAIFDAQQSFLADELGAEITAQLDRRSLVALWETKLALMAFSFEGRARRRMVISCVPDRKRKSAWHVLTRLPPPLSSRLVRLWWHR